MKNTLALVLMVFGLVGCADEPMIEDEWEYLLCKLSNNTSPNAATVKIMVNPYEIREVDATHNIKHTFTGVNDNGYRVYDDEWFTGSYEYHPVYKSIISSTTGLKTKTRLDCKVVK